MCVCAQVNGNHGDVAGSGGQSDVSGGGAEDSGGAEGPQREEGTPQDGPLVPLPQGALHCTQVTVSLFSPVQRRFRGTHSSYGVARNLAVMIDDQLPFSDHLALPDLI